MRPKRNELIAELNKVNGEGFTLDDCFEAWDTFAHYEISHDHETACYAEVWEHPAVTESNKKAGMLNSNFMTLYELKPEYEPNTYRSAFKFIFGRIGNTRVVNID